MVSWSSYRTRFPGAECSPAGERAPEARSLATAKVELVFPGGTYGIRKRMVSAELIPLAEALPLLLSSDPAACGCGAASGSGPRPPRPGVGLVARGRLLPTVGPGDMDAWRAGPLDPSDLGWLRELAAAFPPAAHALAVPGSRPMRLRSPEALVRDLWDAIADTIARSPAAARTTASTAFAATEPTGVSDLADWLADTTDGLSAGARLSLRIEAVRGDGATAEDALLDEDEDRSDSESGQSRRTARAGVPAGAAVAQHQRPQPDRGRRRTVEPAGDRARQVRPAGGDGPAARAAPRGCGVAAARTGARAGQPVGDRPGRRRARQPARPGGRGPGGRRHRGDVAVQHARRRP